MVSTLHWGFPKIRVTFLGAASSEDYSTYLRAHYTNVFSAGDLGFSFKTLSPKP